MNSMLAETPATMPTPIRRIRRPSRKPAALQTQLSVEERRLLVSDHPITFEQWVTRGGKDLFELVNGSLVEKMAAQLDHERLFAWLFTLLRMYVESRDLGEVLGSRTAV